MNGSRIILLLLMCVCAGIVVFADGVEFVGKRDELLKEYTVLGEKMWPMTKLFRKCYAANISTEYETADFEIIRRFLDHGRDDIAKGNWNVRIMC